MSGRDELAGAQNLADALEVAKSLAEFLSLCEFKNANGWPWSLGDEGARHAAAAVLAWMQQPAQIERMARAACRAVGCNDACDFPACGCIGRATEISAAVRALAGEGGNDGR